MLYTEDTIAAVSTPLGTGGIGIIRISGKNAVSVADGIFHAGKSVNEMPSHTIQYGKIKDSDGETIDEVMLTKMVAPSTYTKEDVIEINCHGNIISQQRILKLILINGARAAEPGEFTKRAFLNGRIDLAQAEAVIDVINSNSEKSHKAALSQLSGNISGHLKNIIDNLLNILARIEVTVDYPEHDDEYATEVIAREELNRIITELDSLIESYNSGKIIKSGIDTVIVGKPNVGKSTLLNALTGYQRAIVTDIPGTTRDIIEEQINIDGILLNVKDTAGIRYTDDIVEQIGVEKAKESLKNADLIVYVVSFEDSFTENEIFNEIENKKIILIFNKKDLVSKEEISESINKFKEMYTGNADDIILFSTALGKDEKSCTEGIERTKSAIKTLFNTGNISCNNEIIITSQRHQSLINKSKENLESAIGALDTGLPLDMISVDLKYATEYLGEITGMNISDDLIDKIFSTFCLGK